ncbi:hypothetical protein NMY22_g10837 [Coprinellus aureogranulatus]|nr:hypothetical protein NMY22_g10837 [Coprinellus aureogranulatus]
MADARPPSAASAGCGIQAFSSSHNVSIGSFSATTVGRNFEIQYITNNFDTGHTPVGDEESIQERRSAIMESLKAPNFRAMYQQALKQRMAKTGLWFLEMLEFKAFLDGKGVILWCTGMPGSGKTILASIAVEHLEMVFGGTQEIAIAFAFIRYSEKLTLRDILSSLLSQLVEENDTAYFVVWSFYRRATAKTGSQFLESEMEAALRELVRGLGKVYVVIDGLDEASDELKDALLEVLAASGANILILSRPLDLFVDYTPDALFVSIQAQTEDIGLYVADQVKRSSRLRAILRGKPELVETLSERIKEKANGMFLLARLQTESIMSSCASVNGLFHALEKLPSGVEEMYHVTMERINAQPESDVSIAHRVFALLLHPSKPPFYFTVWPAWVADVQQYLAVDFANETFNENEMPPISLILSSCGGLVTAVETAENNSELQFIHYTAREYIKDVHLSAIPVEMNSFLAVTFAIYLEAHIEEILALEGMEGGELVSCFDRRHFLRRSAQSWGSHAAESLQRGKLPRYIHFFLTKYPLYPFIDNSCLSAKSLPGLHLAGLHGLVDVIVEQNNLPCYAIPKYKGYTPFHFAAQEGHFDAFRALASNYPGIDLMAKGGKTFLHIAVAHGRASFVEELFRWIDSLPADELGPCVPNFDVNAQDNDGVTPLLEAVKNSDEEIALMIISRADTRGTIRDNSGGNALYYACQSFVSEHNLVEKLLSAYPELTVDAAVDGCTPLMEACTRGYERVCTLLLDRDNTLIHEVDSDGMTPLMWASWALNESIVRLLLERGANMHVRDSSHNSAFLFSARGAWWTRDIDEPDRQYATLRLFLEFDHNCIYHRDSQDRTALMFAVQWGASLSTLELFLSHSNGTIAYVNAQDQRGLTVAMHVFQSFTWDLHSVANLELEARFRLQPKILTESLFKHKHGQDIIGRLLCIPRLNIYQCDRQGRTSLEWACSLGGPPLFQMFFHEYHELLRKEEEAQRQFESMQGMFFDTLDILAHPPRGRWDPHALHRAVIAGTQMLADTVVCRFLQKSWVLQAFDWILDEEDMITLLAQALRRKCRVASGMILTYAGLLGGERRREWSGMVEVDIARCFCGFGCDWHSG